MGGYPCARNDKVVIFSFCSDWQVPNPSNFSPTTDLHHADLYTLIEAFARIEVKIGGFGNERNALPQLDVISSIAAFFTCIIPVSTKGLFLASSPFFSSRNPGKPHVAIQPYFYECMGNRTSTHIVGAALA